MALSGDPTESGQYYLYLRVQDEDYDPVWRLFNFSVGLRSSDPAQTNDFEEMTPVNGDYNSRIGDVFSGDFRYFVLDKNDDHKTNYLELNGPTSESWVGGWPSQLILGHQGDVDIYFEKSDKSVFDLYSFELGSRDNKAYSAKLSATYTDDTITTRIYNFPADKSMTKFTPDLVGIKLIQLEYFEASNAQGNGNSGAIDNLVFNYLKQEVSTNTNTDCPCIGLPSFTYSNQLDYINPVIDLGSVNPLYLLQYTNWVDTVIATDNVDGNLSASIQTTGSVDTATLGRHDVYYSVSDSAGNVGTAFRTVLITNTNVPTYILAKDVLFFTDSSVWVQNNNLAPALSTTYEQNQLTPAHLYGSLNEKITLDSKNSGEMSSDLLDLLETSGRHYPFSEAPSKIAEWTLAENESLLLSVVTMDNTQGILQKRNTGSHSKTFYLYTGNLSSADVLIYTESEGDFHRKTP